METKTSKPELIDFSFNVNEEFITLFGAGKFKQEKIVLDKANASLLFVELWKFLKVNKEPITYTEQEVWKLLRKCLKATGKSIGAEFKDLSGSPYINYNGDYLFRWFNNNKKK